MSDSDQTQQLVYGHRPPTSDEVPRHPGDGLVIERSDATSRASQLTLSYHGELYIFDSVTPEKMNSVLLLLGGHEIQNNQTSNPSTCQPAARWARRLAPVKWKKRCSDKKN